MKQIMAIIASLILVAAPAYAFTTGWTHETGAVVRQKEGVSAVSDVKEDNLSDSEQTAPTVKSSEEDEDEIDAAAADTAGDDDTATGSIERQSGVEAPEAIKAEIRNASSSADRRDSISADKHGSDDEEAELQNNESESEVDD